MSEFRIQRVVDKPLSDVWAAFTDAAALAAWFWPPRFETTVDIDLRVGGEFRIASDVADLAVSGTYVEIAAPGRLVHTWRWDGDDEQTLVTMTFLEVDGGTGITILHERFGDEESARQNEIGWNSCLDRLDPAVQA
jgi:uncharacterized protein YndB with AHSA1/START domain